MPSSPIIKSFQSDLMKFSFKLVVLGDGGVGKTCLINRFCFNTFMPDSQMTIGVSFNSFSIPALVNGESFQLGFSIWDFGGQERFSSFLPQFIRDANAAMFVFDLYQFKTLDDLITRWLPLLQKNDDHIPIMLVSTKKDLEENSSYIPVEPHIIMEYQKKIGAFMYYETSSKTGFNSNIIFTDLLREVLKSPLYQKYQIEILNIEKK